jgi:hypothetical protein
LPDPARRFYLRHQGCWHSADIIAVAAETAAGIGGGAITI